MELEVKTGSGKYNIILEHGALQNAEKYLNLKRRVLIVTDSGVPKIYAETLAKQCTEPFIITLPEGESSKCFESFKLLLKKLVEYGFTRTDCVVAVGGGVVGDLSGFTAASYMRGIDFYNIPTTLLSQVDSSIGGKTAIDFEGYKNIVGAFYPPKCVIIDSETLKTLPKRQISNGLAEALKMSATCDPTLFSIFENEDTEQNIDAIIEKSLRIKKYVVEKDEKESGLRKVLNFGHTLAHAIETANAMQNLYHGECVAIGMIPMCDKSVRKRLIPILKKLDLPYACDCDFDVLSEAISHDKKMSGKSITVVYVPEVGKFELKTMTYDELLKIVKEALCE